MPEGERTAPAAPAHRLKPWLSGATIVLAAGLLLGLLYKPAGSVRLANGTFAHDCCGTVQLRDGRMIINGKDSVRFALGRDAHGPYILPQAYVGAFEDKGYEVDGTRPATKLRLDRVPDPATLVLTEGRATYILRRQPRRSPK